MRCGIEVGIGIGSQDDVVAVFADARLAARSTIPATGCTVGRDSLMKIASVVFERATHVSRLSWCRDNFVFRVALGGCGESLGRVAVTAAAGRADDDRIARF